MEILYTTIDKLFIKTQNKDGSPLVNYKNEPYKQVGIQVAEYPNVWLTHYVGNNSKYPSREMDLVAGEMQWIKVEEKVTDKTTFYNFKLASELDKITKRVEDLEQAVYKTPKPTTSAKPFITKKDEATAEPKEYVDEYFEPSDVDMSSIPF